MKFQTPLCIILILGMTASCGLFRSEDIEPIPGTVRLETALQWNGENYAVGNVTADAFGHPFRLDNLQLYMAPVEFRSEDGEWVSSDDVFLIDYGEHGKNLVLPLPAGAYSAVRFGLGIPPEINTDIDPASYPNDHPLSVLGSAGMFWTWSSGYIFVKYEGKFALESGQQLIEPFSYHCGTDASYRMVTLELDNLLNIQSHEVTAASLKLDAAMALMSENDSINVEFDPVTHNAGGDSLGGRMMDFLVNAWSIEIL